jgi:hypothetical protein
MKTLIPYEDADIPEEHLLIKTTMVLKAKYHQNGELNKLKARICGRGDMLAGYVDSVYSPTVSALTFATVLQLSIIDRMHACTFDTVGAYLYQEYPQDSTPLFVTLPKEVAIVCGLRPEARYRINKYIYGLPDSGRAYYKAYSEHLMKSGYKRTVVDPCLFVRIVDDIRTYVWCHVDDTFVCSTHKSEMDKFNKLMSEKFTITMEENVTEYLGIKFNYLSNGTVTLSQPKLMQSIFDMYLTEDIKLSNRTISAQRQPVNDDPGLLTPVSVKKYMTLLGSLMYLVKSRPDIATAVSFAATKSQSATQYDYDNLIHIVKYLWQTKDKGLCLQGGVPGQPLTLTCYVDASYLTHADSKSHTGYTLSFGTMGTFYSKSSKQPIVTTSSTHAEIRALYSLCIDIVYVVQICEELNRPISLPAIVMEDSQPSIDLVTDLSTRAKRSKHFLMLIAFVREKVADGIIQIMKVDTKLNLADMLTKIVTGSEYHTKADLLLGISH